VAVAAEPDPQEQECMAMGTGVHGVVVDALHAGQADGTIRADLGDLKVTSRVLWGFTHGTIPIAMTKDKALARATSDSRKGEDKLSKEQHHERAGTVEFIREPGHFCRSVILSGHARNTLTIAHDADQLVRTRVRYFTRAGD
jgi:hypothetical protein